MLCWYLLTARTAVVFCFFALLRRSSKFSFLFFFNLVAKPPSRTGVRNHEPQRWAQTAAFLKIPPASDTHWSRLHNLVFHRLFLMIHCPRGGEFQLSLILFFFPSGTVLRTSSFSSLLFLPPAPLNWVSLLIKKLTLNTKDKKISPCVPRAEYNSKKSPIFYPH